MHKNEIRYLFDDELKEVFKECVKYLVERDILLPLSEDDNKLLYVPKGFAHGFISLQDNTIFQYLVDNDYAPDLEDGISLDDEELNIEWRSILKEFNIDYIITSEKDKHYISFKNRELIF